MTSIFTNNNIVLFDIGEIPYDPDYIKRHRDDFDIYGNYIGYVMMTGMIKINEL